MLALTQRMDNLLMYLVVSGAVLLLVTQFALRSSLLLPFISRVDRLEGGGQPALSELASWERYLVEKTTSSNSSSLNISIQLLHPRPTATIKLLVNGEIRGSFTRASLDVRVNAGDLLEIDCMEEDNPVTIRIDHVSSGVVHPKVGQYLNAEQEIRPLGIVELEPGR